MSMGQVTWSIKQVVLPLAIATLTAGCGDSGDTLVAHRDPCLSITGYTLDCPPPSVGDEILSIEAACSRLAECGHVAFTRPDGGNRDDWSECIAQLDSYSSDRLEFVLRCIEVSTCADLRSQDTSQPLQGPCFLFGAAQ
ncbi:MAG: hypothetical protein V2A73_09715 [Pseudomonadota bacterium]